jgi:hypothetical protein
MEPPEPIPTSNCETFGRYMYYFCGSRSKVKNLFWTPFFTEPLETNIFLEQIETNILQKDICSKRIFVSIYGTEP